MRQTLTRRALLSSAASLLASAALAGAPERSIRPAARPGGVLPMEARKGPPARPSLEDMITEAELTGDVSVALWDAATGTPVLSRNADVPLPPASVTKALTALYALEILGPSHRFETRILATAPIVDGVLDGDLILAGGGDPTLVTDHMAEIAEALRAMGLREVRGRFGVWGGALPYLEEIDPPQLDYLGYNPAVSGLNLNFNRVHFEWARSGGGWRLTMDARSEKYRPEVVMSRMRLSDRSLPIFDYVDGDTVDEWTVARSALGNGGSRWLPVRKPALYAGDVLGHFIRGQAIKLSAPMRVAAPEGEVIHTHRSAPLTEVLRDMLKFSTNLTAEAVGLAASYARRPTLTGHEASARMMTGWLNQTHGTRFRLDDHSGLSDLSRVTANDLVKLWAAPGVRARLWPILKDIPILDAERRPLPDYPGTIRAKTGTLNFVTTLSGYQQTAGGRDLAFAILAADLDRRAAGKAAGDEVPNGSITYNTRAKGLQQALLKRWGLVSPPASPTSEEGEQG